MTVLEPEYRDMRSSADSGGESGPSVTFRVTGKIVGVLAPDGSVTDRFIVPAHVSDDDVVAWVRAHV
jgi:hypothetical protein